MSMKPRVALVTGWTNPERRSIIDFCTKLLLMLEPLSREITWLATNLTGEVRLDSRFTLIRMKSRYIARDASPFKLILPYLLFQARVLLAITKLLPKADVFVFAQGSDISFLSILLVRLGRKKIILRSDGRPSLLVKKYFLNPGKFKIWLLRIGESISYALVDRILPENQQLADVYEMHKYDAKISIGSQYVDTDAFRKTKNLAERTYKVGYVGRLIREKGALGFANSLPLILKDERDKAIVIGDGELRDEIEQILIKNNIQHKTELLGWVENKQLPGYLNDIGIVVVPSDYEGLSNLVLEAMSCGTLVLATPVGGIPGVIREGETGFVIENSSPECIAENIIRVFSYPNLEQISENARALIEQEYTYQAAVARYRKIFESLA